MTEWRVIEHHPNYAVSENGDIYSNCHKKILKQHTDRYGYRRICLKPDNRTFKIHRLVAECFVENPENKDTVDHINRNKDDNRVVNLRWASWSEQALNRKVK